MIELLTSPTLYVITTTLCVLGIARSWNQEQNPNFFRAGLALALAGNATVLGMLVC